MSTHPSDPENPAQPNAPTDLDLAKNCAAQMAPISEADLARAAGLQREDLKKLRAAHLLEGEDWTGGTGKPVVILARGVEKLQAALKAQAVQAMQTAAQTASQGALYVRLVVHRSTLACRNKRLVLAVHEGAGGAYDANVETVRVDVKKAALFKPGMLLERCQASKTTAGFFHYHGRMPRRPGKF